MKILYKKNYFSKKNIPPPNNIGKAIKAKIYKLIKKKSCTKNIFYIIIYIYFFILIRLYN